MKFSSISISIFLVFAISTALIVTGGKMRPGIGILAAILLIPSVMLVRSNGLAYIGMQIPVNWSSTILQSLGYGILFSLLSMIIIEPLSESLTTTVPDYGPVEKIKGNWLMLLQMLLFVWLFVAVVEEIIFRGFLMAEISKIIGSGLAASIFNVVFTSVVFGFCHAYQNRCGIITTGLIGSLFAIVFLVSGRNLWVSILTHGFFDTIGILSIYFGADKYLSQLVWKA
jgi:membrane protease YdiL (CAAX protease family)